MLKAKTISKTLLMALLSLIVVLAMMPAMAFADTVTIDGVEYESEITITNPGTIITGSQKTMEATYETNYTDTSHVDWTIASNSTDTGTAAINKHQGVLTPTVAGTITITATLRTGSAGSGSGTGSGTGSGCTGTALATTSETYTIYASTTYGYQGTGGNTMLMTAVDGNSGSALSINASTETDSDGDITGYNNEIVLPSSVTAGQQLSFTFKMSAGTNNFQPSVFNENCVPNIDIYEVGSNTVSSSIDKVTSSNFNTSSKEITIYPTSTLSAGNYKIVFGSNVCGNNISKKLGVPISFQFKVTN